MKLSFFFSRGCSLQDWVSTGLFDREKLIYEEHIRSGLLDKVYWFTYGTKDEILANELHRQGRLSAKIELLSMPNFFLVFPLGVWLYSFLLPLVYRRHLVASDFIKTNQMDGSWSAVITKILFKKKLIVRTGYTISRYVQLRHPSSYLKYKFWCVVEGFAYRHCDRAIVSSIHDKEYIDSLYKISNKCVVMRNYIDTDLFSPVDSGLKKLQNFVWIGRISEEKNLFSLVDAVVKVGVTLDIYGKGELEIDLKKYIGRRKNVRLMGGVRNYEIPNILNRYGYYVLSSFHEGMPKTLLEAMSCGLVCIGTNVEGINEVIEDEVNGFLATGTSASSLANVFERAINSPKKDLVRKCARDVICDEYSLSVIKKQEENIIKCLHIHCH
jgi:glycosyltransferase involved in cell wall biosynthesis